MASTVRYTYNHITNEQWRHFNFFESSQIKDHDDASLPGPTIFSTVSKGSVIASDNDYVYVGDQSGRIHALDSHFCVICSLNAYNAPIDHILSCADHFIITLGEEGTDTHVLKVWSLRGTAFKHVSTTVLHSDKPFPITCCTALPDLTHVAVGFSDGRVVLVKGDLARDRGSKQRTVYEGEEPITGLEFLVHEKAISLYIFSTSKMLTLTAANATGKSVVQVPRIMESVGAALGCVAQDYRKNEITVVRKDAIYMYGVDGRGPCYAMDGRKTSVHVYHGYAIVIQPPNEAKSGTMKVLGTSNVEEASRITIVETENKFIAHVGYFPQGLRAVFSAFDALHLLTMDGRLFRLSEVSMDLKMDILFDKSMYTLALTLAENAKHTDVQLNEIRIKYADYLYSKGEFETSVQQYIQAIKGCEISAVMRKFLEAQHVPLLTEFLEALHEAKLANADYTTLLLNCYAKLKQKDKLQKFIRDDADRPVDLDIAVALCRQAGYFDQAISLTSKHKNHPICLGIMIEDKKDHKAALTYIKKLKDLVEVQKLMLHFGRELMTVLPSETTNLLIDLYTGSFISDNDIQATGIMSPPRKTSGVYGGAFYESMLNSRYTPALPSLPALDMSQFNPMRRVASITPSVKESSIDVASGAASTIVTEEKPALPMPPPRSAFPMFIDYPSEFIHFLESIQAKRHDMTDADRTLVCSTLLELYLKQANADPASSDKWKDKAKTLLTAEPDAIDTTNALLLFHLASFKEGSIMLQEKAGRTEDVFRAYCASRDTPNVIKVLQLYGDQEPHLYPLALKYFTSSVQILADAGDTTSLVLSKIHERRLLSPLQVIQLLSETSVATIGVIKNYLQTIITREKGEIQTHTQLINSYKAESHQKTIEIEKLQKEVILQGTRCALCSGTLDVPVSHFLCGHSFHDRCAGDTCALCAESHATVTRVRAETQALREKMDLFVDGLDRARDKPTYVFSKLDLL